MNPTHQTARRFAIGLLAAAAIIAAAWSMHALADDPTPGSVRRTAPDAAEPDRPLVLAYYYPWYTRGDWTRHEYAGTPVLGEYGTDDPAIAERHVKWAADAGIDVLVVSWWGEDHLCAKHMAAGLLKAPNLGRIRFCMIYESLGRLDALDGKKDDICDFADGAVRRRFAEDLTLLRRRYFDHASYLKVGGRPVVVLYVTRTFRNFDRATLEAAERAAGVDVYAIADEPFIGDQKDPATARHGIGADGEPVFDAYTAYNMFENARVREGETATDYMMREGMPVFEAWAKKTAMFPHVMPSYRDFRGNKPLIGGLARFRRQLRAAAELGELNAAARGQAPHMIFVTSFNEWWEGTTIEPAAEYGTMYLGAIETDFGKQRKR